MLGTCLLHVQRRSPTACNIFTLYAWCLGKIVPISHFAWMPTEVRLAHWFCSGIIPGVVSGSMVRSAKRPSLCDLHSGSCTSRRICKHSRACSCYKGNSCYENKLCRPQEDLHQQTTVAGGCSQYVGPHSELMNFADTTPVRAGSMRWGKGCAALLAERAAPVRSMWCAFLGAVPLR